jgi:hypothetical protein
METAKLHLFHRRAIEMNISFSSVVPGDRRPAKSLYA